MYSSLQDAFCLDAAAQAVSFALFCSRVCSSPARPVYLASDQAMLSCLSSQEGWAAAGAFTL